MPTFLKKFPVGQQLKQLFSLKPRSEAPTIKYKQRKLIYTLIDLNNLASYTNFIALGTCTAL